MPTPLANEPILFGVHYRLVLLEHANVAAVVSPADRFGSINIFVDCRVEKRGESGEVPVAGPSENR